MPLSARGFACSVARSAEEALRAMAAETPPLDARTSHDNVGVGAAVQATRPPAGLVPARLQPSAPLLLSSSLTRTPWRARCRGVQHCNSAVTATRQTLQLGRTYARESRQLGQLGGNDGCSCVATRTRTRTRSHGALPSSALVPRPSVFVRREADASPLGARADDGGASLCTRWHACPTGGRASKRAGPAPAHRCHAPARLSARQRAPLCGHAGRTATA